MQPAAARNQLRSGQHRGFSLVELMVAIALSIFLLGGVIAMFASSKGAYETNRHLSQLDENGRYALEVLAREIRGAGFKGCNRAAPIHNMLISPTDMGNDFRFGLGGHNYTNAAAWSASPLSLAISGAVPKNDVLVVRAPMPGSTLRLTASMAADTDNLSVKSFPAGNQGPFDTNQILMVGTCEASSIFRATKWTPTTGTIEHDATGNTSAGLIGLYPMGAPVMRVRTTAYYIGSGSNGPALFRQTAGTAEEIVEGIDFLQLLFGIDADGNREAENYVTADAIADWNNVVSINVGIVVRTLEEFGSEKDSLTHTVLGASFGPANDRRIRKVFTSTVALRNVAW